MGTTGIASSVDWVHWPGPRCRPPARRSPRAVAAARAVGSPRAWNLPCHAPLGGAGPSGRQGPQVGPSTGIRHAGPHLPDPHGVLGHHGGPRCWRRSRAPVDWALRPAEFAMLTDTVSYLPDDLLVKVDRLDGGRIGDPVPILDPVVYAEAWRLAPAGWPTARASVSCATSCTATSRPRSPRAPGRLRRSVRRLAAIRSASMGGGAARRGSPEAWRNTSMWPPCADAGPSTSEGHVITVTGSGRC